MYQYSFQYFEAPDSHVSLLLFNNFISKTNKYLIRGGLNENYFQRLMRLNAWLPVSATVFWKGLGCVALLEEVCHCGYTLRF